MTYNEYGQALDAGFSPDNLTIFNYTEMGNDLLEDGLYVMEDKLADPAFADKMVRFVRASMKGWQYALDNPDEAAQIVVDSDESGAATLDAPEVHDGRSRQAGRRQRRRARPGRPTTAP